MFKKIKNILIVLCVLALVCSAVYAVTYKVPAAKSNTSSNTNQNIDPNITGNKITIGNYNVYTPANYSNTSANQGIQQGGVVELVIDYSGSMSDIIEDVKKIALNHFNNIPSTTKIGLRVIGQSGGINEYEGQAINQCPGLDISGSCSKTTLVLPFAHYSSTDFYKGLNRYKTGWWGSPIIYGLYLALEKDLATYKFGVPKKIILITDGGETCCDKIYEYVPRFHGRDAVVDVILTSSDDISTYAFIANRTGGILYQSDSFDESSLGDVLMQSIQNKPPQQTEPLQQTQKEQRYEYVSD